MKEIDEQNISRVENYRETVIIVVVIIIVVVEKTNSLRVRVRL